MKYPTQITPSYAMILRQRIETGDISRKQAIDFLTENGVNARIALRLLQGDTANECA